MTDRYEREVLTTYAARNPRSAANFESARRSLAGGNTRMSAYWSPFPLTVVRGEGSHIWDADGNRYLDLLNNYTSLVHGHAHPKVTGAIIDQCSRGTCWPAYHESQGSLAEALCQRVKSVERVRFVNSGTEAGMLALTIARIATGRQKILMAAGGYHGSTMEFMLGTANRPTETTLVAPYNDEAAFTEHLRAQGQDIAAVFLEPVMGAGGVVEARPSFVRTVREEASRAGALFVLDEVITLRLDAGGRQAVLDVTPDLTMLGKLIGGGLPVGAVGGSAKLMRLFDPPEPGVYHAGTFNGNPLTMSAGLRTLELLTASACARMGELAKQLAAELVLLGSTHGVPISVNRVGSILNVFLTEHAPATTHQRQDADAMRLFHLAALNEGVFFAPRGMMALSTAMTEQSIAEAVERLERALIRVRDATSLTLAEP